MRHKPLVFAILIAVVFGVGLTQLFLLRYDSGEVYPEYSSLRSDPRGARALFESLERMPGLRVSRNVLPIETLKDFKGTLFYLGVSPKSSIAEATKIAAGGARVVVGMLPPEKANEKAQRLFEEEEKGKGTLVILHDCYWLSNEALLKDRDADLLAELAGPARQIVFDESHLGVTESGSLMGLARKYGLGGFVFATLLLFLLFIWKNSMSLLPPMKEVSSSNSSVQGRDSKTGFVNLLRRSVPRGTLLRIAHEQWRATLSMGRQYPDSKLQLAAEAAKERDAVAAYQKIAGILRQREGS